jgi:hypothetical protein
VRQNDEDEDVGIYCCFKDFIESTLFKETLDWFLWMNFLEVAVFVLFEAALQVQDVLFLAFPLVIAILEWEVQNQNASPENINFNA